MYFYFYRTCTYAVKVCKFFVKFIIIIKKTSISETASGFDALGGVLQPTSSLQGVQQQHQHQQIIKTANHQQSSSALLTGDLESSLASLAENLSINRTVQPPK